MKLYCNYCGYEIRKGILDKIKGTYIKIKKGYYYVLCNDCQSKLWQFNKSKIIEIIQKEGKIKKPYKK